MVNTQKMLASEGSPKEPQRIIAGVATIPERIETLRTTLESIYWQVDEIYVYLNNFDEVPAFLDRPAITVLRSQDYGDLKDVGKFFALRLVQDGVLFTLDDDIRYPPDYVARMIEALEAIDYGAVIGVHGVVLAENPKSFFDRQVFVFDSRLDTALPVSFLGTGTCAFDIRRVGLPFCAFTAYGMADLHLGVFLKRADIPAIIIAREDNWLEDLGEECGAEETLYQRTRRDSTPHNTLIRNAAPWGQKDIMRRATAIFDYPLFSDEVKFALRVIDRASSGKKELFRVPEQLSLSRPIVDSSKWMEVLANPDTLEQIYLNALKRNTRLVRMTALAGLWKRNRHACIEQSRAIAVSEPTDAGYLLEHAKYCAMFHLPEEAKDYFECAARQVWRVGPDSRPSLNEVLFEYFSFLISAGFGNEAEALSGVLRQHYNKHPIFNRGMLLIHLAGGEHEAAMAHLTALLCHRRRNQQRYVRELMQMLGDRWGVIVCGEGPKIEVKCIEDCRKNPAELANLMKIAFLLGDDAGAEACWSELVLGHCSYLDMYPELRWYYHSNISANEELAGLTVGRDAAALDWGGGEAFQPFKRISAMGRRVSDQRSGPKISVVMTAYNAASTIEYAIKSILNQTHANLELIVIDDVSTDDTVLIVERLACIDSRIKLLINDVNMGPYRSRNVALDAASGAFIAIHDADDAALPDRFEHQLAAFAEGIEAVLGSHVRIDQTGRLQLENDGSILGHGPMTLMFRRSILKQIGRFAEVRTRGDKEFESRIEHFYGSHSLLRLSKLLVCCLHDRGSNSHQHISGPDQRRALMLFKEMYSRQHSSGNFEVWTDNSICLDAVSLSSRTEPKVTTLHHEVNKVTS